MSVVDLNGYDQICGNPDFLYFAEWYLYEPCLLANTDQIQVRLKK